MRITARLARHLALATVAVSTTAVVTMTAADSESRHSTIPAWLVGLPNPTEANAVANVFGSRALWAHNAATNRYQRITAFHIRPGQAIFTSPQDAARVGVVKTHPFTINSGPVGTPDLGTAVASTTKGSTSDSTSSSGGSPGKTTTSSTTAVATPIVTSTSGSPVPPAVSTAAPTTTTTTAPPQTPTASPTSVPTAPASGGSFSPAQTNRWAGWYEDPGPVTSVSATWVVPKLSCGSGTALSSTWVGAGGLDGGYLLQAGLFDQCIGGVEEHGGFVEEYPGATESLALAIAPGDTVTATVAQTSGGNWGATVTDNTNGESETGAIAYSGPTSAELMLEAYGQPDYPIPSFSSETFSTLTVNGSPAQIPESGAWELVGGAGTATPSDPASGSYRITQ